MEPMRDNNPSGNQADMAWLIDLGEDFNFSFTFKTPDDTSKFNGPNLTFRYDYDEDEHWESGVITVMIREKPLAVGKVSSLEFELLVDQWKTDRSAASYPNHVGDYQSIGQLYSNTWYTMDISVRDGKTFIVDLSSLSKGVVDRRVNYTFFAGGKESFYNPTFWAYLDGDDSRIPVESSDEYWIGSVEASLPEDE